jgi:hypothetical protein
MYSVHAASEATINKVARAMLTCFLPVSDPTKNRNTRQTKVNSGGGGGGGKRAPAPGNTLINSLKKKLD